MIKNIWDTTYDEILEEIKLPSKPENVIGIMSVIYRIKFLA